MPQDRSPEILVTQGPDGTFAVEVRQGTRSHEYAVTVPAGLAARLGHPSVAAGDLIRESFLFLLEREPATSILARFSLDVIARYFSEYDDVMAQRLADRSR